MLVEPPKPSGTHFYRFGRTEGPRLGWLQRIISEHRLYIPTANELNDPLDCRLVLKRVNRAYFAFLERGPRPLTDVERQLAYAQVMTYDEERLRHKVTDGLHERLGQTRVYSMAAAYDNLNMWAAYAGNSRGYCLEFRNTGIFEAAREVVYQDDFELDIGDASHATYQWFFYKRSTWSNEREIRLVVMRHMLDRNELKLQPRLLNRIILGETMSSGDRAIINRSASTRSPKLEVWRSAFDHYDGKLKLRPPGAP